MPELSGPDFLKLYPPVPRKKLMYVVLLEFSSQCAFDRMPECREDGCICFLMRRGTIHSIQSIIQKVLSPIFADP